MELTDFMLLRHSSLQGWELCLFFIRRSNQGSEILSGTTRADGLSVMMQQKSFDALQICTTG